MNLRRVVVLVALPLGCGRLQIGWYTEESANSAGSGFAAAPAGSGTHDGASRGGAGGSGTSVQGHGGSGGGQSFGGAGSAGIYVPDDDSAGGQGVAEPSRGGQHTGGGRAGGVPAGAGQSDGTAGEDPTIGVDSAGGTSAGEHSTAGRDPDGGAGSGGVGAGPLHQSCHGLEGQCSAFFGCCSGVTVRGEDFMLGTALWPGWAGAVPARVSAFYPDTLEVTVGRFARFVEVFESWTASGHPHPAAGEHPLIPETGWRSEWTLPASRAELERRITECNGSTYAMRDSNPELPMNCVSWFEAFAFCLWDGQRLLTEAEWELAAKAGSEQRKYPWGDEPEPNSDYALYQCLPDPAGDADPCEEAQLLPVGSKPLGRSRDGLHDLAGSVAEWVFDAEATYQNPCIDCANTTNPELRMFRGGGFRSQADTLRTEYRYTMHPGERLDFLGLRCARSTIF